MKSRDEKRRVHFHKQKHFLKTFTGTISIEGLFLSLRNGKVTEKLSSVKEEPEIVITEDEVVFNKNAWADNPMLVDEFILKCIRQAKKL